MDVIINGNRVRLGAKDLVGEGGEAEIYQLSNREVAKIFKNQGHASFLGDKVAEDQALVRLSEHQHKLADFPKGLPSSVVAPVSLVNNTRGTQIIGYTMPFLSGAEVMLKYCERRYREVKNISDERVVRIFETLHKLVHEIHGKNVVIGDFNDLNILIHTNDNVHLIDADSMQYGPYLSRVFTPRFVDPLHCSFSQGSIQLNAKHTATSDWYAYAVMLMQALLYVGPYGGVHVPKKGKKQMTDAERVRERVTVFAQEVRYPRPARHYSILPDELLHFLEQTFAKDFRHVMESRLVSDLIFTTCPTCKKVHARNSCPDCRPVVPSIVKEVITGNVEATRILNTSGRIVYSTIEDGIPRYVYHEQGVYYRDGVKKVIDGEYDSKFRFRIFEEKTIIAKDGSIVVLGETGHIGSFGTDQFRAQIPVVDACKDGVFVSEGGFLKRYNNRLGLEYAEVLGSVLENQTLVWVSDKVGFVFYQVGQIMQGYIFNTASKSIGKEVAIPQCKGTIIDATAVFSGTTCYFMITSDDRGTLVNRVFMISTDGVIVGKAEAKHGDGSWLSSIRGKCATGKFLFSPTDDGIVRTDLGVSGDLLVARVYSDTVRFVDSSAKLLFGRDGIYVVTTSQMWRIRVT